jgi:ABC-type branched-subunit amino acid transport system ATPase component
MSNDFILQTRDLTREFKGFVAVDRVNIQVKRGSIHALIGPNGAGKTTVFNLLTKFLAVTSGQIFYKGKDITQMRAAEVARAGMVRSFQISAVFPHLSVLENVRIGLQRKLGTSFHFWKPESSLYSLWPISHRRRPWSCPTGASGRSKLLPRWPSIPNSCCSMSPPRAWAMRTWAGWSSSFAGLRPSARC